MFPGDHQPTPPLGSPDRHWGRRLAIGNGSLRRSGDTRHPGSERYRWLIRPTWNPGSPEHPGRVGHSRGPHRWTATHRHSVATQTARSDRPSTVIGPMPSGPARPRGRTCPASSGLRSDPIALTVAVSNPMSMESYGLLRTLHSPFGSAKRACHELPRISVPRTHCSGRVPADVGP